MSWFGLFDLLRFRPDASMPSGWALPGSKLRLTDRHLAALYHGAVTDAGHGFHADMFDIASHHLARSCPPGPGTFHLDMRMTGRAARMLFGSDQTQSILAWHTVSKTAWLRLAGSDEPVALPQVDLLPLLHLTLPIEQIATLSAWVDDAAGIEQLMKLLDPWLTSASRAIIRLPQTALPAMLARLPAWPARCVAVLPCSSAADAAGAGETVNDVIVCFEDISAQVPEAAITRVRTTPRALLAETWNDKPRHHRSTPQGGVIAHVAADRTPPTSGLPVTLLGEAPATLAGAHLASLQSRPFQPVSGFDYLLDISAATIMSENDTLFIIPQRGPVIIDPAAVPDDGAAGMAPEAMQSFLAQHGVLRDGRFFATPRSPVHSIASRPTLLLNRADSPLAHITQTLPNLQHLFELCDRERLALADFDVLIPGADRFVIDSLLLSGLAPAQLRFRFDGVLFRRLLLANPASQADSAQRGAIYDRFWARSAASPHRAGFVSFSQPKPSGKVLLADPVAAPVINGADLQAMARDRGYQIINPANPDMATIIAAMAAARVVVGPGALLGWSCLASNASLGMLTSGRDATLPYAALHSAAARGHTMVAMFGSSMGGKAESGLVVAPDRFTALLDRVEAGASAARANSAVLP